MMSNESALRELVARVCTQGDELACLVTISTYLLAPITLINAAWPLLEKRRASRIASLLVLWGLLAAELMTVRMPFLLAGEPNPDESQDIAEGITLSHDFRLWRAVDGHTHGFPVPLLLLPLRLLGLAIDHIGARLVTIGVILLFAATLGLLARRTLGSAPGVVAFTVVALSLGCINSTDLVVFNAEYVALLTAALAGLGLVFASRPERRLRRAGIAAAAALIVLLPFVKLQVAPLAFALGLLALVIAWRTSLRAELKSEILLLFASGAGTLAFLISAIAASGGLGHFIDCYIRDNISYANAGEWLARDWVGFTELVPTFLGLAPWGVALLAGAFAGAANPRPDARRISPSIWFALFVLALVLLYCIYRPARVHHHYLNFFAFPCAALVGLLAAQATAVASRPALIIVPMLAMFVWLPWHVLRVAPNTFLGSSFSVDDMRIGSVIAQFSRSDEKIAVWGWMARYFVLSQRPSASRHPITEHEIRDGELRAKFRDEYMADLHASDPPVFVDAVGPFAFLYTDRASVGHEIFPELAQFVSRSYDMVEDLGGVRIYVQKKRLALFDSLAVGTVDQKLACLDDRHGAVDAPVSLGACKSTGAGRTWRLERRGAFFRMASTNGELCVRPSTEKEGEWTEARWDACSEQPEQLWAIVSTRPGAHVVSKQTLECLSANRTSGRVMLRRCRNVKSELWPQVSEVRGEVSSNAQALTGQRD